jgi:hypothetical protein
LPIVNANVPHAYEYAAKTVSALTKKFPVGKDFWLNGAAPKELHKVREPKSNSGNSAVPVAEEELFAGE